ncbi:MAG: hypothetical protein ABS36_10940 [Acidobacteria bacterium SCN 69-37]|nr:MAG: hypothetical protein ABS36_10940 [Acidobacteria bacterium SCN 69-37]
MSDMVVVASAVIDALEGLGVRYSVGGSMASSFGGEPRASIDVDIVVAMTRAHAEPFVNALGPAFYADVDAVTRAIASGSSVNVIHRNSGIKVDLFVARSTLDRRQLERRRSVVVSDDPLRRWFVHSPEDILIQKLLWYRDGGEVSDRQWRDVLSILLVQGGRLDDAYVTLLAIEHGLLDLLERARREAIG